MRKSFVALVFAATAATPTLALAQAAAPAAAPASPHTLTGSLGLYSSYRFRGIDQTFGKLLAQEELSPADALAVLLGYLVEIAERPDGDITRVAVQAWAEALRNDTIRCAAQDKYAQLRGYFVELARKGQRDGTIAAEVDPEHVGQAMFGLIPGFILQRLILGDVTPEGYTAGFAALIRADR